MSPKAHIIAAIWAAMNPGSAASSLWPSIMIARFEAIRRLLPGPLPDPMSWL